MSLLNETSASALAIAGSLFVMIKYLRPRSPLPESPESSPQTSSPLGTRRGICGTNQANSRQAQEPQRPHRYYRTTFGMTSGTWVTGWPSYGGKLQLVDCNRVELDFLVLDHFDIVERSQNQEEEDAHCEKMSMLGAVWWPDEIEELERELGAPGVWAPAQQVTYVGWTDTGGVWVLSTGKTDAHKRGLGRIKGARSMEEQCQLIGRLGGTFYPVPDKCPHLDLDGEVERMEAEEFIKQWELD